MQETTTSIYLQLIEKGKKTDKQCLVRMKVVCRVSTKLVFEGLWAFCKNIPTLSVGYVYSLGRLFFTPLR